MIKRRQEPSSRPKEGDGDYDLCALCLDQIRVPEKLQCNHTFCKSCLEIYREARCWVAERCPVCRHLLDDPVSSKQETDEWLLFGFVLMVLMVFSVGPFYLLLLYW
ncbi:uncharacterized protein Dana_GF11193 [Drosophila ananassae]|uniref:RING-type domain-containing protein n=1 Tax=Drosophila ananassae TaxID=7217 RepID=B3MGX4_DROAN|nr:tripartite motif-containing protein 3 [Drosophila ananassae]EDV37892.1 uncharacterized protein Dana_GF11193 [Drosophila ananassae]